MPNSQKSNSKYSKRRLVENEVIFRDVNKNIKEFIEEETAGTASTVLPFYCECSDPECIERINLSTTEYENLHKGKNLYVTVVGHEFTEVEKVVKKDSRFQVVQKHFKPPNPKDIDMALKAIIKDHGL
jgi:hypothetical protein